LSRAETKILERLFYKT